MPIGEAMFTQRSVRKFRPDPIPAGAWHTNESLISFPFDVPLAAPAKDVMLLFDVFRVFGDRHTVLGLFDYRGTTTEAVFSACSSTTTAAR